MPNEIIVDMGSALKAINAMGRNVNNMNDLTAEIAEIMLSDISQHFEDEEGPGGVPWADLADSTKEARRKKGHWPGKKLQVQGRGSGLLGSLQGRYDKYSSSVTTNKVYGPVHQYGIGARSVVGSQRRMPPIPARPFMYLSADAKQEIPEAVEAHIIPK